MSYVALHFVDTFANTAERGLEIACKFADTAGCAVRHVGIYSIPIANFEVDHVNGKGYVENFATYRITLLMVTDDYKLKKEIEIFTEGYFKTINSADRYLSDLVEGAREEGIVISKGLETHLKDVFEEYLDDVDGDQQDHEQPMRRRLLFKMTHEDVARANLAFSLME